MLNLMRKNAGTWLIKILLGAIVLVFVFWGVGSFRNRNEGRVAVVNGDPVMVDEYNQTYNRIIEQIKRQYGSQINDEMLKMMQIKKQAMDQLIDKRLLLAEAKRLDFSVSNTELIDSIKSIPAFQHNGIFDNRQYRAVLAQNRLTPENFESLQRENLLMERLRNFITDSVKVSDAEIEDWYQWKNAEVNIDYVLFNPSLLTDIHPADAEVKAYYDSHKEAYKTEAKRKVDYLQFAAADFTSKVTVSDADVKNYFEANPGVFDTPKTVEASHILIKADQNASPEVIEKAKEKALMVMKLAKEGKDFAELAKKYSDDPSAQSNGGHLGAFKRNEMVEPFAEKAFSMSPGDISEPVKTQFGWHIIKVEKVNNAVTLTLDQAKPKIIKKLTDERAKNLAYEAATTAYNAVQDSGSLPKIAESLKLPIKTTEPFGHSGPAGMKTPAKFTAAAFELSTNGISDIIDSGDTYYILQVTEAIPETIPEFTAVADRVRTDVTRQKQDEQALKNAKQFLADHNKNGKPILDGSAGKNVQTGTTGFFKRSDRIPNIGYERELSAAAFGLSSSKKYPDAPVKGQKGYYVIEFKTRKPADASGLSAEKDQILSSLTSQKQKRLFDDLITTLRNKSNIVIESGYK